MFSASLNVERDKVQTKTISRFLKQMIGHLARYTFIKSLSHLIDQTNCVLIQPTRFEEIIWLLQHL